MAGKCIIAALLMLALAAAPVGCSGAPDDQTQEKEDLEQEGFTFERTPGIEHIKLQKPVRIKLKRGPNGDYTWELTGDDVDQVTEADRKMREYLKIK